MTSRTPAPYLTLLLLLGAAAPAQSPRSPTLLVDINTNPGVAPRSSLPSPELSSRGTAWFSAVTTEHGVELWITDGTSAGTRIFDELGSGARASSYHASVELPNGTIVASCWSPTVGGAVFVARPGATRWTLLVDPQPATNDYAPRLPVVWNGECWFLADDGTNGTELWRTDGTPAGTRVVEDLPGLQNDGMLSITGMLPTASGLWITEGITGDRLLWKASPTTPTVEVDDPTGQIEVRQPFGSIGNRGLLFSGRTFADGEDLWFTDGTTAGTVLLVDIRPGSFSSRPRLRAAEPNRIWFTASSTMAGQELWITDGTAAGTRLVRDNWPGSQAGAGSHAVAAFGGLVFAGADPNVGSELFFSDGTTAGTGVLLDILPGSRGSDPSNFVLFRNRVWFQADDGVSGRELWSTDGTAAGTRREVDLRAGPDSSGARVLGDTAAGLLLRADDGVSGGEPWIFDPVTSTARLLANLAPEPTNAGSGVHLPTRHDLFTLFVGARGALQAECFATRGTAASTVVLPITPQSSITSFSIVGALPTGLVVQTLPIFNSPPELWFTDGTAGGTRLVATGSRRVTQITATGIGFEGRLWFRWDDGSGIALWSTDGTPTGTSPAPGFPNGTTFEPELAHGGVMWGTGTDATHGREPWTSDGTEAGTRLVADVATGAMDSDSFGFTPLGSRVFFRARTAAAGREPWITDGTPAGTFQLANVSPGTGDAAGWLQESLGDRVVFLAGNPTTGPEPWVTDGTVAGTRLLADTRPGPDRDPLTNLVRAGDRALFYAPLGSGGLGIWTTDGTPAGTIRVLDNASLGVTVRSPVYPVGDDGSFVFLAVDPVHGEELWASDGTLAGTRIVADSNVGPADGSPKNFVRFGDGLLFEADDGDTGPELHRLPLADFGFAVAHTYGRGCGAHISADGTPGVGSSFTIRIDASAPGGAAGLVVGSGPAVDVRGPGCEINVQSPAALGNYATDAQGAARLTVAVPNDPALLGAHLHLQSVHLRRGGPLFGSLELTEGLELLVGD